MYELVSGEYIFFKLFTLGSSITPKLKPIIPNKTDCFLLECLDYAKEKYGDSSLRKTYLDSFEQSKEYFLGFLCVLSAGFSPVPLPFPHGVVTRPIVVYSLRKRYERDHAEGKNPHSYLMMAISPLPILGDWVLYTIPSFITGRKIFPILAKGLWDNKNKLRKINNS